MVWWRVLALWLITCGGAFAKDEPLWELGVAVGGLYTPHYLGAEQTETTVLPLPYFVYRGSYIRADRGGIRGLLYQSDRLELRLSLGGALPVNSDENRAREGMKDLDLLLEAGPSLQYTLWATDETLWRIDLPVQAVFSVGDPTLYHRGWTSNPRLHFQHDSGPWTWTANLGPVFGDERYHRYFYQVDSADATAARPRYDASAGFTGSRLGLGVRRRVDDWFVGVYARYFDLHNAANEDSPLMKQRDYFSLGLFVAWVFKESDQVATWDDGGE